LEYYFFSFILISSFSVYYLCSCKEKEDAGSAGEQPASNTLYGYTAKGKAFCLPFSFCRHPFIAKKTQWLVFLACLKKYPIKAIFY
jgi:hypothetical protein